MSISFFSMISPLLLFVGFFIFYFIIYFIGVHIWLIMGFNDSRWNSINKIKIKYLKYIFAFYLIIYICFLIGLVFGEIANIVGYYWLIIGGGVHIITLWFSAFFVIYFVNLITSTSPSEGLIKHPLLRKINREYHHKER